MTWVRPELVMRAELGGWTRDGVVRQAAYKGLEPGRDPLTVHRESAVATTSAVRAAEAEAPESAAPAAQPTMVRRRTTSPNHLAREGGRRGEGQGNSRRQERQDRAATAPPTDVPDEWRITDDELAALDALGKEGVWHANGDELKLTNLDKPLFEPREPDGGGPITKRELIRYFARIAPDDAART